MLFYQLRRHVITPSIINKDQFTMPSTRSMESAKPRPSHRSSLFGQPRLRCQPRLERSCQMLPVCANQHITFGFTGTRRVRLPCYLFQLASKLTVSESMSVSDGQISDAHLYPSSVSRKVASVRLPDRSLEASHRSTRYSRLKIFCL
jgi:hypothetical protein